MSLIVIVILFFIILLFIMVSMLDTKVQTVSQDIEFTNDSSKTVHKLYSAIDKGIISVEDMSVKFAVGLTKEILNSIDEEVDCLEHKPFGIGEEDVTKVNELLEAIKSVDEEPLSVSTCIDDNSFDDIVNIEPLQTEEPYIEDFTIEKEEELIVGSKPIAELNVVTYKQVIYTIQAHNIYKRAMISESESKINLTA